MTYITHIYNLHITYDGCIKDLQRALFVWPDQPSNPPLGSQQHPWAII